MYKHPKATILCGLLATLNLVPAASAYAEALGKWSYESKPSFCSISTKQNPGSIIMMTTKSGASGIMIVPDVQDEISIGGQYKIVMSINGTDLPERAVEAGEFGGVKVLHIPLKATRLAADMPDGLAFRVKMNGKVIFDMDKSDSRSALEAYVKCSGSLTS
jgi:hypothetical protein